MFPRRRAMLQLLLASIREQHGYGLRILVADDGGRTERTQLWGAELVVLPPASGLSAGRNALVKETQTPYVLVLDDDVLFHTATRLDVLLNALKTNPQAVLAAGCYADLRFGREDCFNLRFSVHEAGALVEAQQVPAGSAQAGCNEVDAAHNFFVARTAALRRFGWDPRQKVMEHETFFYQLYLNHQKVLACGGVSVKHNTTRDDQYRERSFRLREGRFMQFLCKNFPEVARFQTPYLQWRCDTRTYCSPAWHAQFPYDGWSCKPMQWFRNDDRSTVLRPLVSRSPRDGEDCSARTRALDRRPCIPLLALVFTEARNVARREWQRATWLSFRWHRGYLDHRLVPWRHVFVMGRSPHGADPRASGADDRPRFDEVVGDEVTLGNATEGYSNLAVKTIEALRWALSQVAFEIVLKVDDDSIVHVGRLWVTVFDELARAHSNQSIPSLYAGRVFRHSQVIRNNFTRTDLWHPQWFPASFRKWAVAESVYPAGWYPPYCGGGGYVLGSRAVGSILQEYDSRYSPLTVIPVEDAFIGVLASAQGISPYDLLTFQEPSRGSLQTREMFIDQVLVHRIMEPLSAFRWLMLSSNCHEGRRACELHRNRAPINAPTVQSQPRPLDVDSRELSLMAQPALESHFTGTRALAPQGVLPSSPDALTAHDGPGSYPPYDKDWISGAIPHASSWATTGSQPPYDQQAEQHATPFQRRKERRWKRNGRKNKARMRLQNAKQYSASTERRAV